MSDITLSGAVRTALLSLQNTTDLIDRTQNRLSTGLRVSSAVDDPVSFFQAKSLSDRASDFTEKKDGIDQGISSVSTALEGVEGIENIVRQLKGVATSLKSATGTQFTDLITQFNSLRTQIGNLADDTKYQGVNLINNTTETLTVSFSEKTGSLVTVAAVNLAESGLSMSDLAQATNTSFNYTGGGTFILQQSANIVVTYQGSAQTLDTQGTNSIALTYGTISLTIAANSAGSAVAISRGDVLSLDYATDRDAVTAAGLSTSGLVAVGATTALATAGVSSSITEVSTSFILEGVSAGIDSVITTIDSALTTLRTNGQTLGSNVALLQTRLDFTEQYVNVLESGSAKLTLADINEEGANLLALQTRQQLGISSLAFAGQAEQGILALFR
jgi:flagellin-like hook-associated protein FlgL